MVVTMGDDYECRKTSAFTNANLVVVSSSRFTINTSAFFTQNSCVRDSDGESDGRDDAHVTMKLLS